MTNDIINNLILYANKKPQGYTIKLVNGKITRVYPSKRLRYVTSIKTIIDIHGYELIITGYREVISRRVYTVYPVLFNKLGELKHDNIFIGGWYDKENNKYLIEIVNIFEKKFEAMTTGYYLKQYSIYDLIEKKEYPVKEYWNNIKEKYIIEKKEYYDIKEV